MYAQGGPYIVSRKMHRAEIPPGDLPARYTDEENEKSKMEMSSMWKRR